MMNNNSEINSGLLDRLAGVRTIESLTVDAPLSEPLALIWLNLDRFKKINASFGHVGGDEMIENLTVRFRKQTNGRAKISKMAGDEFLFIVPKCNRIQAQELADELKEIVETPIAIANVTLRPTSSIGLAVHKSGETSSSLLERADLAMIAAKSKGGACIVSSDDEMIQGRLGVSLARKELSIESRLYTALETGGFSLHYQPIVHVNGHIEAIEALMRCTVDGENISPENFIPVAEKTGLITRLGEWSLLQGATHARRLQDAGYNTKVAINVSRAQLASPKFTQALHAALICSNVKPELIELELTESLFMDVCNEVQRNLKNVISAGVGLAIDDFGTGYSCLANLKDIPAGKLKLDRAFVTVLPDDKRALSVIKAVVQLGHALGMTIVAEGCETQEQVDLLLEAGVDAIQGFVYAKPMSEELLFAWLQNQSSK